MMATYHNLDVIIFNHLKANLATKREVVFHISTHFHRLVRRRLRELLTGLGTQMLEANDITNDVIKCT